MSSSLCWSHMRPQVLTNEDLQGIDVAVGV